MKLFWSWSAWNEEKLFESASIIVNNIVNETKHMSYSEFIQRPFWRFSFPSVAFIFGFYSLKVQFIWANKDVQINNNSMKNFQRWSHSQKYYNRDHLMDENGNLLLRKNSVKPTSDTGLTLTMYDKWRCDFDKVFHFN